MYTKTYGNTYTPFIYLLSFFIGNIQVNLDFYVRVRAYEKRVTGKQPLGIKECTNPLMNKICIFQFPTVQEYDFDRQF